jgi:hypothetical protein
MKYLRVQTLYEKNVVIMGHYIGCLFNLRRPGVHLHMKFWQAERAFDTDESVNQHSHKHTYTHTEARAPMTEESCVTFIVEFNIIIELIILKLSLIKIYSKIRIGTYELPDRIVVEFLL